MLLDLHMPLKGGIEVALEVKALVESGAIAALPLLAVSAAYDERVRGSPQALDLRLLAASRTLQSIPLLLCHRLCSAHCASPASHPSVSPSLQTLAMCSAAGFMGHISKPIRVATLHQALEAVFRHSAQCGGCRMSSGSALDVPEGPADAAAAAAAAASRGVPSPGGRKVGKPAADARAKWLQEELIQTTSTPRTTAGYA